MYNLSSILFVMFCGLWIASNCAKLKQTYLPSYLTEQLTFSYMNTSISDVLESHLAALETLGNQCSDGSSAYVINRVLKTSLPIEAPCHWRCVCDDVTWTSPLTSPSTYFAKNTTPK